jgi:hypothetical protein
MMMTIDNLNGPKTLAGITFIVTQAIHFSTCHPYIITARIQQQTQRISENDESTFDMKMPGSSIPNG